MKVREYEPWAPSGFEIPVPQPEWMYAPDGFGKKTGHISAGAMHFSISAERFAVNPNLQDAVVHCLLSHHGRREWGSPVEPQTLEALLLHQADMASAKFGQTKEVAP
jgi:23S rRNA maturation-related 3'-5' exoribonuclease YhaM